MTKKGVVVGESTTPIQITRARLTLRMSAETSVGTWKTVEVGLSGNVLTTPDEALNELYHQARANLVKLYTKRGGKA